jgi:hypothetical protein
MRIAQRLRRRRRNAFWKQLHRLLKKSRRWVGSLWR